MASIRPGASTGRGHRRVWSRAASPARARLVWWPAAQDPARRSRLNRAGHELPNSAAAPTRRGRRGRSARDRCSGAGITESVALVDGQLVVVDCAPAARDRRDEPAGGQREQHGGQQRRTTRSTVDLGTIDPTGEAKERAAHGRGGDRAGQVRAPGLRVRRHRHRAQPAHPGPRGRRHLLGARRPALRAAAPGLGHGRRRLAGHRHRDRPPRRRSACSTSRASGPATRTRTRCSRRSPSSTTRRPPGACRRSTSSRSSPSWSPTRIRQIRDAGVVAVGVGHPAAHRPAAARHRRRRARRARHPGHGGVGRARLQEP